MADKTVVAPPGTVQHNLHGAAVTTPSRLAWRNIYSHDRGGTPLHNWYTSVAGFSSSLVQRVLRDHNIGRGDTIVDPFAGTGTTALTAMSQGILVKGVEANPFHQLVARTKVNFKIDRKRTGLAAAQLRKSLKRELATDGRYNLKLAPTVGIGDHLSGIKTDREGPPEMPHLSRWVSPRVLARILAVKREVDSFLQSSDSLDVSDLVRVAFGAILQPVSNMQLAGPKIAYRRRGGRRVLCTDAPVVHLFLQRLDSMVSDLGTLTDTSAWIPPEIQLGDARSVGGLLGCKVDLAITSPPYLNEVDYIENTRLELYFLGLVRTEADMRALKERLIRANSKYLFSTNRDYPDRLPDTASFGEIKGLCDQIRGVWSRRSWGWDHPRLVAEYFLDMSVHLSGVRQLLKDGKSYVIVVGDSSIDGVHIPTDDLLLSIAKDVGFAAGSVTPFRWRGSSRHRTPLRESIVSLNA